MRFPMLLSIAFLAPLPALAQTTPSPRLPPANPLAYADPEAAAVMAPVRALFAALDANDGSGVLAQVRPEGGVTVAIEQPDGARRLLRLTWEQVAASLKPRADRNEERLRDPAIEIDGDVAMVWAPYTNYLNGKPDHCGVDLMDMVRENGAWKVLNVTSSHRNTGCVAE